MSEPNQHKHQLLLVSTFIIAICGLIYELVAGTLSSYLLGDSVYHFSLVIGIFMSAMGLGAWLSRFIDKNLPATFINLQILVGLIGGFSALILFYAFAIVNNYIPLLILLTTVLGALLGTEIPLIIRILKDQTSLKLNVSNVFTADYIGALIAALLFPLIMVPQLGIMRTGLFFGLLNIGVGLLCWFLFKHELKQRKKSLFSISIAAIILLIGFIYANSFSSHLENKLYQHEIIYTKTSPYQRIVVTNHKQHTRFYLNGALQFDSLDEYRYHESLVHPAMQIADARETILILGGGDGMAAREVLKYTDVKRVILVDLDPSVTNLFQSNEQLKKLNQGSLTDPRLTVINMDAWKYLENSHDYYDVIIIDLPDPSNLSLSRLYSVTFYRLLQEHLSQAGVLVTQASSPLYSREAYWSIYKTMLASGDKQNSWHVQPYHSYIPSFGEWGFILASRLNKPVVLPAGEKEVLQLKYLSPDILETMQKFPADMSKLDVETNSIHNHRLIDYYQNGWNKWFN